ncbi:MAG: AMP-binding protein [Candidatus Hydrogenedentes bacterium]|nr:AMP-binding protein [Candidatus Hydrogenedentota bacterium]
MEWSDLSLSWHYVEKWARERPEAECMVFGDERLTWAAFKSRVDDTAKALLDIGVQPGDRVAMIAMARLEFPVVFMAANRIGAVWVGLSPKLTVDEIRYILGDCRPTVLVSLHEYLGNDLVAAGEAIVRELDCLREILIIGASVAGTNCFADFVAQPRPQLDALLAERGAGRSADELALLMYTSGSTGKPKGVLHTHRSILASALEEVRSLALGTATRALLHFPINHVAADVEIGLACICAGGTVVMMDRFDPAATLKTVEREKVTLFGQVPAMYLMEFADPHFPAMDWSHVETLVWSGSPAPPSMVKVLKQIADKAGARPANAYGSTELGGLATYTAPDDDVDTLCRSVGKAAPGVELRIVGRDRRDVPDGVVGELAIRGDLVMHGYLNKPKETAAALDEAGWYYSGDLARRDERGYVYLAGRTSDMFISGGENVYPREIEEVLDAHPSVLMAAVVGVADRVFQEVGRAFVVPRPGCGVAADDLRAYCKEHLANYKVPKQFEIRPRLPMLANGKIDKVALKESVNGTPDDA